jgi:flavodoxin
MTILVVYYSRTGSTKKIGEIISQELNSESEEIIDTKRRKGIIGFLISGKDATLKKLTNIEKIQKDPENFDVIIIGTPIWNRNMTPAIRSYITEYKNKIENVAFFCTEGKKGGTRSFRNMADLCEKTPFSTLEITKEDMKTEEYLNKIKTFMQEIKKD